MMVTSDMDVLSFCDASTIITLAHCDAVRRGHPRHQQSHLSAAGHDPDRRHTPDIFLCCAA
jgi:hypothetical protein